MATALEIHPDVEILPGYRLIRKIGSGGYGEVWLCDAPGGLKKAIKIVYGTLDEDRASSELRSLQRIREVKHPFILSLERIEIQDGHLMIVTELAESSLYDQFQAYNLQGMRGIPRDRLIGYLRDTAEALDFLSLKHDLQHLDVKPGNLLLVADRIKLADFGVVKSLSEKQHSCIGGLTPSYAAPEMFDGRAGRHSDQYSLAIMYYELLTGRLPFDGTSMAQLATQHLHHKPNLEQIPDAEQEVVLRALSKDPSHRFPSCSEFIDKLANADQESPASGQAKRATDSEEAPRAFAPKRRLISRGNANVGHKQSTVLVQKKPLKNLAALPDSVNGTWRQTPSLFIGLGGVGCEVLASLRAVFLESDAPTDHTHWLLIDSSGEGLKVGADNPDIAFDDHEKIQIPLRNAHYYREAKAGIFDTISRRWLYNIPRSQNTGGARPLGQVALLDHQVAIANALTESIEYLVHFQNDKHREEDKTLDDIKDTIRIYLVSSAHGGTGSAIFCDIGFAIRNILEEMKVTNYHLVGIVSAAPSSADPQELVPSAASVAFFRELAHYYNPKNEYYGLTEKPFYASPEAIEDRKPPVDQVYFFASERFASKESRSETIHQIAQMMIMDSSTNFGFTLDRARATVPDAASTSSSPWLRTLTFHPCDVEFKNRLSDIVQSCIADYCRKWFPLGSRLETMLKNTQTFEKDGGRTTGVMSESEEYLNELSHNRDQLLSDLRLSGEAWLHKCSNAIRMLYPKSRNPFAEPIEPIVDSLYRTMIEGCYTRSRLSSIPCKINIGLLTGLFIQAKKLEEILRRSKQRHEQDLDALKLLGPASEASPKSRPNAEQEVSQSQLVDVSRKLQLTILRYDASIRILEALIQRLDEPIQQGRRRLAKLHRSWSSWPSLLPEQGGGNLLKELESDALGIKLAPMVDEIRRYVCSALRSVSTHLVLGQGEATQISGAAEGADLVKLLEFDPDLAFDFSKVLFAMENLLLKDHPDLIDGQLEQMWFQHQVGQKVRQVLDDKGTKLGDSGGMRRIILAAPVSQSCVLARGTWRDQMELPVSIISAPVEGKLLGIELEQLELHDICNRFWGHSQDLLSLVDRMYARTDTQWDSLEPPPPPSSPPNDEAKPDKP